jgi:hypothetical protein
VPGLPLYNLKNIYEDDPLTDKMMKNVITACFFKASPKGGVPVAIRMLTALSGTALVACNVTSPDDTPQVDEERSSAAETCDRIDNDLDGLVDEDFKNDAGVYDDDEHCGRCGAACVPDDVTEAVQCEVTDRGAACRATRCIEGYVPSGPTCVPWNGWLCLRCLDSGECGGFEGASCEEIAGELRCTAPCIDGACPDNYTCESGRCVPPSKSCNCEPGDHFTVSCTIDVNGSACFGNAECNDGVLSPCAGSEEICDRVDNNCDGETDEPFVDAAGQYTRDLRHCGACGVDCTLNHVSDFEIICGGSSLNPTCAILCEDTLDGIGVGDFVDADLDPENGCECEILAVEDAPGADTEARPDVLDANCDGVDGMAEESIYVIPTGDDTSPGTPDAPFGTIQGAVDAAFASLATRQPRPHVYVASGVYSEVLRIRDGVNLHGGYRPDFLDRDSAAYATEIHAPSWADSPGGAALVATRNSALSATTIEGLVFRGASAPFGEQYAFGAYLDDPGPGLRITDTTVRAGDGSDGDNGKDGEVGATPFGPGGDGAPQRAAVEDGNYACLDDPLNTNLGGSAGSFFCDGTGVSGGKGGDATCGVSFYHSQAPGEPGQSVGAAAGGAGGAGGWDASGPIIDNGTVYCGLADFMVSAYHEMAADGEAGVNGDTGIGGAGCADAIGILAGDGWSGGAAEDGRDGSPGGGGGGGGAGGSAIIDGTLCPYTDGIGGGGGGGGAGGCGGKGGVAGTSGGPSVGIVVRLSNPSAAPTLTNIAIITGIGGAGGQGGHGGDGGQGGQGGRGGELLTTERTIPPLSGADSGGEGGAGGAGGRGGGGGGGCGGSAVGIWLATGGGGMTGEVPDTFTAENRFTLGTPGGGGESGVGGASGTPGQDGGSYNVLVR